MESNDVIDLSVIEELRQLDAGTPAGLLKGLIDLFTLHTPPSLREMTEALELGNFKRVREVAHTLKSSSGNLGARQFSIICAEIEKTVLERGPKLSEKLHELVPNLQELYMPTATALEKCRS